MPETKASKPASPTVTPVMAQYLRIKERYPDEIVFFRLGDFYEMFFEDAARAAPVLEVALTKRQGTPMCGIPYHAVTGYLAKLLKAGISVALAEQLEDPKKTRGMVKRGVVRVMTPGTIIEDELLPSRANNFLVALTLRESDGKGGGHWALAAADVSTGRQWVGEVAGDLHWNRLRAALTALAPSEVLFVGETSRALADGLPLRAVVRYETVPPEARSYAEHALFAIRDYLSRHQSGAGIELAPPQPLPAESGGILFLDESAIRHLELVESSDPAGRGPTLFGVVNQTVTALGARMLRWWLLNPSTDKAVIDERLDQVEDLVEDPVARAQLREALRQVADLERIRMRILAGTASPRDLAALRRSLLSVPEAARCLADMEGRVAVDHFDSLIQALTPPAALGEILGKRLADEPPAKASDGGVFRDGVDGELDELRALKKSGRSWIARLEAAERERTGITNLKIGYNDVFGYFLEVSRSHLGKVPPEWIRKQTLANAERYVTPPLKEQEEKILGAQERILAIEQRLYAALLEELRTFRADLARIAEAAARLDGLAALAEAAVENGYVRPEIVDGDELAIVGGRHPVIERQIGRDRFIPNDVRLGGDGKRIVVITGPNMAGKSTYLRQTALVTILAQMGSFVPAESARIGVVDKIFTRIGATDRLAQGQSTFMVEMNEVATLLLHATGRSLLVLDEVGRGTSTYDGVSIAWAVIDYLSQMRKVEENSSAKCGVRNGEEGNINGPLPSSALRTPHSALSSGPRTLFATHYFELTQLEASLPAVMNAHATAKEWPGADGRRRVVFLYQIKPGPADRSYGIHVAEMAGVPEACIDKARAILKQLEGGSHRAARANGEREAQLDLFSNHPVLEDLKRLRVDELTPLEALNKLADLKKRLQ